MSNENENLNVGSTVQLKSGGPCMTIKKIHEDAEKTCVCQWFDENRFLFEGNFPVVSLQKHVPDPVSPAIPKGTASL